MATIILFIAISTAVGNKFKPIIIIIAPVTCGGKYFFTFLGPATLIIIDIIIYNRPDTIILP